MVTKKTATVKSSRSIAAKKKPGSKFSDQAFFKKKAEDAVIFLTKAGLPEAAADK